MRYTYAAPSREECAHRLRAFAALDSTLGFAPWTAVERREGRVVGWGGLGVDPFDPGWGVEVSYFFGPACWGRGYATELVSAALEHGFASLSLPAIGAFVRPDNGASVRVLEKCGFTLVGYEPQPRAQPVPAPPPRLEVIRRRASALARVIGSPAATARRQ